MINNEETELESFAHSNGFFCFFVLSFTFDRDYALMERCLDARADRNLRNSAQRRSKLFERVELVRLLPNEPYVAKERRKKTTKKGKIQEEGKKREK